MSPYVRRARKNPTDVRLGNELIKLGSLLKVAIVYHWETSTSYRLDTPKEERREKRPAQSAGYQKLKWLVRFSAR